MGEIMMHVGDILSTVERCPVPWGISGVPWGVILSTMGDTQYRGRISWCTWTDIMSTVGVFSTVEENLFLFEYPMVLNSPTVLMMSPTCIMICPHGTQITKDGIPHCTEHPDVPHDSPMVLKITPTELMISPTVLKPRHTQDIPPHLSWFPTRY